MGTPTTSIATFVRSMKLLKDITNYLDEDGKPDIEKMQLITYEPVHHGYVVLGERVGNAFSDGKKLK